MIISKKDDSQRINQEIRAPKVRLIGENGNQIGIVNIQEALREAEKSGLDLVEVSPNASPPVCKILDYGKYKYQQQKHEKENRKKQHVIQVKEIRFRPGIDVHDIETKTKKIREFIEDGSKVKVTVMFRGREMAHKEYGQKIIDIVSEKVSDIAKMEGQPSIEGRFLTVFLVAK
ncbi:MAG: translation initiation factor IF-3 [Candidatus Marinimicrobia bacterium]|nr:translation initiation factor IF-3 [Candidatus Neomarinimicrobiota bacterium]MDD5582595.1 translation initiation factor IF-3 [Candidatus Neomarinimicrobiota bacterium]